MLDRVISTKFLTHRVSLQSSHANFEKNFVSPKMAAILNFRIFRKKGRHFWRDKNFFQNWDNYSAEIPFGSKISSKSLYLAGFSRYKHFCVLQFLRKFRKFKMAAIFGETKFFSKLAWLLCRDTLWVKNFVEITLSSTVFEI